MEIPVRTTSEQALVFVLVEPLNRTTSCWHISINQITWSHGHMVTWSHGHMVTWSHGHMVTWSHGHMVTWSHGHMVSPAHTF